MDGEPSYAPIIPLCLLVLLAILGQAWAVAALLACLVLLGGVALNIP